MATCLSKVLTEFITIFCFIRETFEGSEWGACAVWGQTDALYLSVFPLYALCEAFEIGGNVIDVLL